VERAYRPLKNFLSASSAAWRESSVKAFFAAVGSLPGAFLSGFATAGFCRIVWLLDIGIVRREFSAVAVQRFFNRIDTELTRVGVGQLSHAVDLIRLIQPATDIDRLESAAVGRFNRSRCRLTDALYLRLLGRLKSVFDDDFKLELTDSQFITARKHFGFVRRESLLVDKGAVSALQVLYEKTLSRITRMQCLRLTDSLFGRRLQDSLRPIKNLFEVTPISVPAWLPAMTFNFTCIEHLYLDLPVAASALC
jgi:hypothetical protein